MAKRWNLGELVARLKFVLDFNPAQTNQSFIGDAEDVDEHFRDTLNESYAEEVLEAKQIADPGWFKRKQDITWPASQLELELPQGLRDQVLVAVQDVTSDSIGAPFWPLPISEGPLTFWSDRDTLQWSTTGPGSARTLRIYYLAEAEEMRDESAEPTLMPREHRPLIYWTAAIKMRCIADQEAPKGWYRQQREYRERYWKALSMGRPMQTGYPGIRNTDPDASGFNAW